ncbi:hypothetical protein BpHYR1_018757 [Brachionus plicatilis]|uniref:Uncharacterized protein n=1 Tax=Brachionus plicatilis TaxID=10195 RepID=A0A3M7QWC9_BRAPC|nr:hypothetical protein BpHYR1_018757 [Brachionus plicatilis]
MESLILNSLRNALVYSQKAVLSFDNFYRRENRIASYLKNTKAHKRAVLMLVGKQALLFSLVSKKNLENFFATFQLSNISNWIVSQPDNYLLKTRPLERVSVPASLYQIGEVEGAFKLSKFLLVIEVLSAYPAQLTNRNKGLMLCIKSIDGF